jgi:putative membrane protein
MRQIKAANILFCLPVFAAVAVAHEGKPHNPGDLWHTWSFDPVSVICLAVSALIYIGGVHRLWKDAGRYHGVSLREALLFAGGWTALFIALVSPLHPWGEVLFSAHMTQHEILMLIAAPLLAWSRPLIAALWAIPLAWRKRIGAAVRWAPVKSVWQFIAAPFAAWIIHALALWLWHIPSLFQATLESDLVHTLQHASFFLTALLFWWSIIAVPRGVANYGAGVLYLFTTSIHSGLLGAFLTFTQTVYYPAYSKTTESWGLSPIEDQQLGGLIMWAPSGLVYIFAGLLMFAAWLAESEKRVLLQEKRILVPEVPE